MTKLSPLSTDNRVILVHTKLYEKAISWQVIDRLENKNVTISYFNKINNMSAGFLDFECTSASTASAPVTPAPPHQRQQHQHPPHQRQQHQHPLHQRQHPLDIY